MHLIAAANINQLKESCNYLNVHSNDQSLIDGLSYMIKEANSELHMDL